MNLNQWAIEWGVPFAAVEDLRRRLGTISDAPPLGSTGASESAVQGRVRIEASEKHNRLWRNNVGALQDATGRWVRYGLCNESIAQNKRLKSSDLIGIRPIRITAAHVGALLGQFVAREVKPEGWQFTGDDHESAQLTFLDLVLALGGDAAFASSEGTILPGEPVLIDTIGNGG